MKILHYMPDRLVLQYQPFATWFGCGFVILGSFLVPTLSSDPWAFAIWFGLIGFSVLFLIIEGAIVTNIFDKKQQYWILRYQGLLGTRQQKYALSDIGAIVVKESYYKGAYYEIFIYFTEDSKQRIHQGKLLSKSKAMKAAEAIAEICELGPIYFIKGPKLFSFS